MNDFKSIFRYLRKREGYTQSELAERLKFSKSAISMYENGKREPDFETLELIADFFNVDINFLMGKSENKYNLSEKMINLIEKYNYLEEYNQKAVDNLIDSLLTAQAVSGKQNRISS